jgi:hypothetical protein
LPTHLRRKAPISALELLMALLLECYRCWGHSLAYQVFSLHGLKRSMDRSVAM